MVNEPDDDWLIGDNDLDDADLLEDEATPPPSACPPVATVQRDDSAPSRQRDSPTVQQKPDETVPQYDRESIPESDEPKDGRNPSDAVPQADSPTEPQSDGSDNATENGATSRPTASVDESSYFNLDDPWGDDGATDTQDNSRTVQQSDSAPAAQSDDTETHPNPTIRPATPAEERQSTEHDRFDDDPEPAAQSDALTARQSDSPTVRQDDSASEQQDDEWDWAWDGDTEPDEQSRQEPPTPQHPSTTVQQSDSPTEKKAYEPTPSDERRSDTAEDDGWWDAEPGTPAPQHDSATVQQSNTPQVTQSDSSTVQQLDSRTGASSPADDPWDDWESDDTTAATPDRNTGAPAWPTEARPDESASGWNASRPRETASNDEWDDWDSPLPAQPQSNADTAPQYDNPTASQSPVATGRQSDAGKGNALRSILKPIAIIMAIILAAAMLIAGGAYAYTRYQTGRQTAQQQEAEQRRQDRLTKLQKRWDAEHADATTLIKAIDDRKMGEGDKMKPLIRKLREAMKQKPVTASQLRSATDKLDKAAAAVRKEYDTELGAKAKETGRQLTELLKQADGLNDAPDTDNRKKLRQLAAQWKDITVDRSNMDDAAKTVESMKTLVAAVTKERDDQKAKEEAEKQAQEQAQQEAQQQAQQSTPQQSTPNYGYGYGYSNRNYGYSYSGGSTGGGGSSSTPQQSTPQQSTPAQPSQPQKQPGSSGQTLG